MTRLSLAHARSRRQVRPRLNAPEDRLRLSAILMSKTIRRFVMAVAFGFLARGRPTRAWRSSSPPPARSRQVTPRSDTSFTTNQAITVVALDAYAVNAAGNQVRLYDSTGTTLASATVLPTDPIEGSPTQFFSHAITPLSLAAGRTY